MRESGHGLPCSKVRVSQFTYDTSHNEPHLNKWPNNKLQVAISQKSIVPANAWSLTLTPSVGTAEQNTAC